MEINFIELSGIMGMGAAAALTLNYLMGMLISVHYKKQAFWKKLPAKYQSLDIVQLHNITAYIACSLVLTHPLLLLADATAGFSLAQLFFFADAPTQALPVKMGTIAFYAIVLVILTTQQKVKKRLGFRLWKNIHLISYCTALLFCIHGIWMDPLLKDRPVDWLDAEKLFCEGLAVILLFASYWRYQQYRRAVK